MKKVIIFTALILMLFSSFTAPPPVEAQGCGDYIFGNFPQGYLSGDAAIQGFYGITGNKNDYFPSYVDELNHPLESLLNNRFGFYHSNNTSRSGVDDRMVAIQKTFASPYRLCNFDIRGRGVQSIALNNPITWQARYMAVYVKVHGETTWTQLSATVVPTGVYEYNIALWSGSVFIDAIAIVGMNPAESFLIQTAKLNADPIAIKRPLLAYDEDTTNYFKTSEYTMLDEHLPLTNTYFPTTKWEDSLVYNAAAGEVIEIETLTGRECNDEYTGGFLVDFPSGFDDCFWGMPDARGGYDYEVQATGTIHRVRVSGALGTMTYVLSSVNATEGDVITEGCALGTPLTLNPDPVTPDYTDPLGIVVFGFNPYTNSTDDVFTAVTFSGYVTPGDACGEATEEYELVKRPLLATDQHESGLFDLNFEGVITFPDWNGTLAETIATFLSYTTAILDWLGMADEEDNPSRPAVYVYNPNVWRLPSNDAGDPVFSTHNGTVTNTQPFEVWCSRILYNNDDSDCNLEIPPPVTGLNYTSFVSLKTENASIVTITADNGFDYHYMVDNRTVRVGQEVTDKCILGYTMETGDVADNFIDGVKSDIAEAMDVSETASNLEYALNQILRKDINPSATYPGMALMAKTAIGDQPWDNSIKYNYGAVFPVPGARCDTDPAFTGCLNFNPQFRNSGEFWQVLSGVPSYPNDGFAGAVLPAGAGVYMVLPLDPAIEYSVTIQASNMSATGSVIRVQLGLDTDDFTITQPVNFLQIFTMPAQTRSPDAGGFYTFAISNRSSNPVKISSACVRDGEPDVINDSGCYFVNSSFDTGLDSWTTSGTISEGTDNPFGGILSQPNGTIRMYDASTISQNVKLYPNEDASPHTYTAFIQYELTEVEGQVVKFEYAYGGSYEDFGTALEVTVDTDFIGPLRLGVVTESFTVSALIDTDFTIRASIKDGIGDPIENQYIKVHRVCIQGPYPQQGIDSGPIDPFPENCDKLEVPENTSTSNMIAWHWYNTDRFNQCQLMPRLNEMYALMNEAYTFSTRQFQWQMWNAHQGTRWLGEKAMPWLAGYLSNIQPGQIIINDSGCNDLFCLLNNLVSTLGGIIQSLLDNIIAPIISLLTQVLGQAFNLLFGVITAIIALVLGFIGTILEWIQTIIQLFGEFIGVWSSAPPTPIPGLPSCLGPSPHSICTFWDATEATFFSGTGALIVPLASGFISILIMLRLFSTIRGMIMKASAAA